MAQGVFVGIVRGANLIHRMLKFGYLIDLVEAIQDGFTKVETSKFLNNRNRCKW